MKKLMTFTLSVIMALTFSHTSIYAQSVTELQKKKSTIKSSTQETQQQLNSTREQKSSVLLEVEAVDEELERVISELDYVTDELEKTEALLDATSVELSNAEIEREEHYALLKDRLRIMYENSDDGYLSIILKANNFSDLINRIENFNRVASYDKDLLQKMQEIERLITQKYDETEQYRNNLQALVIEQETKKHSLDTVLSEKTQLLATLDANEQNYLQRIKDLEKSDKEIETLIKKAQEEAARKAAESAQKAPVYTGGKLAWPVPSSSRVTSEYGYRTSPKKEFHAGIDIGVPIGNNIVAAEAGTVIFSGTQSGYGLTVIIDHGGKLSTLYAHNSKLLVKVGQIVKKNDVIAKSGNTGYSTGPHCHFGVMVNGAHTNPNSYLGR